MLIEALAVGSAQLPLQRSRVFGSSCAVMMMTGGGFASRASCSCSSTPVIIGICRSSTTQSGTRPANDSMNEIGEL